MSSKKTSKKSAPAKAPKAPAVKAAADPDPIPASHDIVSAVNQSWLSNREKCCAMVEGVQEHEVPEVLAAQIRYGKISINDLP